jgi:putative membrane protein
MDFLQFSLSGFDDFLLYFGLSLGFVVLYLAIYVRATPYREFALIRAGNAAAAASLSEASSVSCCRLLARWCTA